MTLCAFKGVLRDGAPRVSFPLVRVAFLAALSGVHLNPSTDLGNVGFFFLFLWGPCSFSRNSFWTFRGWSLPQNTLVNREEGIGWLHFLITQLHNELFGSRVQTGILLGWLLWKSLAFPQWRPVFSLRKSKGRVWVVTDCSWEGSPQTVLELTALVTRQGPRIRTFPPPVLQKCVDQFSSLS